MPSMNVNLEKEVGEKGFDASKYVADLALKSVGSSDLLTQRQKIQGLSDNTNALLKKNVYQHYMQFIETAKEISYLEGEMYQLAHMLTEQKALLATTLDKSITGVKIAETSIDVAETKIEPRATLDTVKEKVDGCDHVVAVANRELLYDSDIIELDAISFTALHRVHGYLFNDGFMLATWVPTVRDGKRYKFEVMYELHSLAVVNVKDTPEIKHAFKIMHFLDSRLIQCANRDIKNDWLDAFERAKKGQKDEKPLPSSPTEEILSSPDEDESIGSSLVHRFGRQYSENELDIPEWMMEAADDLDVFIAQREFEEAVELLEAGDKFCKEHSDAKLQYIVDQLHSRRELLIAALVQVLEVSQHKSLQGGPRAARRAVHLLIRLGRSTKACELFVARRTALLNHSLRQLRIEGATLPYVGRQASVFFNSLMDSAAEFGRAFPDEGRTNRATFGVWASNQLRNFLQTFHRQVFIPEVEVSLVAECVQTLKTHSQQLQEIGMDLSHLIDIKLQPHIEKTLKDARDKLLEAVRHRAADDPWRPMNLQNKAGVKKLVDDMADVGVAGIGNYVYDECYVSLTNNTVQFAKSFLAFLDDCLKLASPDLSSLLDSSIVDIFMEHMRHVNTSMARLSSERKFITKNAGFLVDTVLSLAEHRYQEKLGQSCQPLVKTHKHLAPLVQGTTVGVTKTTTNYL